MYTAADQDFDNSVWSENPMRLPKSVVTWFDEVSKTTYAILKLLAISLTIILVGLLGFEFETLGYQSVDSSGWIPHRHVTPVWIQGDWMPGEYRVCQMRTKTDPPGDKDPDSLGKLPRLFCGEDGNGLFDFQVSIAPGLDPTDPPPPHEMYLIGVTSSAYDRDFHDLPVEYWGKIDRTDQWVISWRCQRNEGSLSCKALN